MTLSLNFDASSLGLLALENGILLAVIVYLLISILNYRE